MKLPQLLVVEDDPAVRALLVAYLEKDGYHVASASTVFEAEQRTGTRSYAMVIVDLGLPDEDGLVFARRLRTKSNVPIVFVTERSTDSDKIAALEMGGDDYVTKPFNPRELSARIHNILIRSGRGAERSSTEARIAIGEWWLDVGKRTFEDQAGNPQALTRAEFDLLSALVNAKGRVLCRNYLLDAISSKSDDACDRTIDVLVSRLRRKIEPSSRRPRIILTVPGIGYRIDHPTTCKAGLG